MPSGAPEKSNATEVAVPIVCLNYDDPAEGRSQQFTEASEVVDIRGTTISATIRF